MRNCMRLSFALAAVAVTGFITLPGAIAQQAASGAPPPSVTVVKAVEKDLRPSASFSGRVEAIDKVDLRARVDGFLEQKLFEDGQDVKAGDLLFVMEKGQYAAAVAQAQGNIEASQAVLSLADIEVKRQTELVAKSATPQSQLDLAVAKQQQARGQLDQLNAALTQAQLDLSYTEIRTPIAGRVGAAQYSIGNFVGASSNPLATVVSQDPIYVSFTVSQREILDIRKKHAGQQAGALVYVELADGSRYGQVGKIDFVDVTVNQGTDSVLVRASFANPDRLLIDGQLVDVKVEGDKAQPVLVIPQAALQIDQGGPYVLLVTKENKIEVRYIVPGGMEGSDVSVAKGLTTDDLVVTEGIQKVRPGQVVAPVEAKSGS
ncbi:efflux RND transporter periplasmic adaptor subunit [Rhizobium sp. 18055]|jgi:membrane fusion protein (multidrug efflux system)|uniref:efflux RND transporter periplasmic adaptor subunit n=1 Tax=Rhizobium sp. 18055 TaxID=2681403 RepID=UPI001358587A|nr:efflux RND transporter periplasmic adaptor subunit [Rhizobium sp. 18055]